MLGAIVEHARETSIGPEHLGIGSGEIRDEVEHDVALRGTQPREAHAGERPQVLPGEGPGPLSLDAVHLAHPVHEQRALEPARRVEPRRSGRAADEQAAQHGGHDDDDPGGDERIECQVPDDLEERRRP